MKKNEIRHFYSCDVPQICQNRHLKSIFFENFADQEPKTLLQAILQLVLRIQIRFMYY